MTFLKGEVANEVARKTPWEINGSLSPRLPHGFA